MARPLHPAPPVAPDGAVAIGDAFRLTAAGLVVSGHADLRRVAGVRADALRLEQRLAVGDRRLDRLRRRPRRLGETYTQAIDATQKSYDTVQRAAWVSGAFQLRRRRRNFVLVAPPRSRRPARARARPLAGRGRAGGPLAHRSAGASARRPARDPVRTSAASWPLSGALRRSAVAVRPRRDRESGDREPVPHDAP